MYQKPSPTIAMWCHASPKSATAPANMKMRLIKRARASIGVIGSKPASSGPSLRQGVRATLDGRLRMRGNDFGKNAPRSLTLVKLYLQEHPAPVPAYLERTSSEPRPGKENTFSTITAPLSSQPIFTARIVITGIKPFRSACFI